MIRAALALTALALCACASTGGERVPRSLIPADAAGADIDGWVADVPTADDAEVEPSFVVRDGMLVSLGRPLGHLVTEESFADYRLTVEYRWPGEPGNCGVLVHASELRHLNGMFPKSLEVQLQSGNAGDFWCIGENISVPDMASRRRGDPSTWGGGARQSRNVKNLTDDSENPPGEWNTMVVECLGDRIDVWVNGDRVNDGYDCTASSGRIALQAEGAVVEFRRLDVEPL